MIYYVGVCYGACFQLSGSNVATMFTKMGAQPLGFAPLWPFEAYPWQACMPPGDDL